MTKAEIRPQTQDEHSTLRENLAPQMETRIDFVEDPREKMHDYQEIKIKSLRPSCLDYIRRLWVRSVNRVH